MATLSYAQLKAVWLNAAAGTQYATNAWASLMGAIALAESGGNPSALNPNDNGGTQTSWGLWQVSLGNHSAPSPNWNNPTVNAQLAIGKLESQGLSAWGTYTSGAYRTYLNDATTADGTGIPPSSAVDAAALTAASAAQSDCAWAIGWGGIAGTSWLNDLFGSGGNVGAGELCVLSKSEARAAIGAGMLAGGILMIGWGANLMIAVVGLKAAGMVVGQVTGAQKQAGAFTRLFSGGGSSGSAAGGAAGGAEAAGGGAEAAELAAVAA
jgi:hypothetical protein